MTNKSGKGSNDGKNPMDNKTPKEDSSSKSGSSFQAGTSWSIMSGAKNNMEKFDGNSNFGMWQCKFMNVLIQQELDFALGDKPETMTSKNGIKSTARRAISPSLFPDIAQLYMM